MNMYNPYAPNPYIQQGQQQNLGGIDPMYQNIGSQQANQNSALGQQNQLMNQAAQLGQQSGGGINPMMMAMALRQSKKPNTPAPVTDYSQPMPEYLDPAYNQAGY
jgi:hypothetical protein